MRLILKYWSCICRWSVRQHKWLKDETNHTIWKIQHPSKWKQSAKKKKKKEWWNGITSATYVAQCHICVYPTLISNDYSGIINVGECQ